MIGHEKAREAAFQKDQDSDQICQETCCWPREGRMWWGTEVLFRGQSTWVWTWKLQKVIDTHIIQYTIQTIGLSWCTTRRPAYENTITLWDRDEGCGMTIITKRLNWNSGWWITTQVLWNQCLHPIMWRSRSLMGCSFRLWIACNRVPMRKYWL